VSEFYLPYLVDYNHFIIDQVAIFCVAVLTAILVSAEGQGFTATLLGDSRFSSKDRLHFNVFAHMSLLGTLSFFIAGFGWSKEVPINTGNFKNNRQLRLVCSRLGGPIANLLLASISASLSWLLVRWGFVDQVFSTMVVVNVTMALYNLIPIPPLPGGALLVAFIPEQSREQKWFRMLPIIGACLLVGGFAFIRLIHWQGISAIFNPLVTDVATMLLAR